jgi:hypothetical protein
MNRCRSVGLSLIGGVATFSICFYFGSKITFTNQWPLYDALRSTASIIFAVIGAWLTILYPDEIKKIFNRKLDERKAKSESIDLLVANIQYSTFILAAIMSVGIVGQILRYLPWALTHTETLRRLSFGFLGFLTFMQFWTLLMTLAQAEIANKELADTSELHQKKAGYMSSTQTYQQPLSGGNDSTR